MSGRAITFKKDEVIVLLGAGASVDAGIPHSAAMVEKIQSSLAGDWAEFKNLYNYVRSAIFYADGIQGTFHDRVSYNIERLVVSLDELARREDHPIYPFIGAWNPRLIQVAGADFRKVFSFKNEILDRLRHDWIEIENYEAAGYFKGLINFQRELNYPLRVFTLNYDLCVEKAYQSEYNEFPERGFDRNRCWSHELLEDGTPGEKPLYLYKLHGSIDWMRDATTSKITFSDSTSKIGIDEGVLIFGTTQKLQYLDPFLFLVYQLRKLSLDAKLLLVIGYGFGDEHINGILSQALHANPTERLVAVTTLTHADKARTGSEKDDFRAFVARQLGMEKPDDERIVVYDSKAKDFFEKELSLDAMSKHFPDEETIFAEVAHEVDVPLANADAAAKADESPPVAEQE
jgi:hypothetical protein